MATVDGIGLAEPSTITKSLAAALIQRNSSNTYQELMSLADPDSTTAVAIAKVTNATPESTAYGLAVRRVRPSLLTVASTAGTDSLATMVAGSTAAGTGRIYVTAFCVDSTEVGPVRAGFYSMAGGASSLVWPVTLWAGGGRMTISEAVGAPSYLFATSTGSTLTFQVGSTGIAVRVAVTYSTGV